jgi:DNA-binding NarL/FixJ family response regulator
MRIMEHVPGAGGKRRWKASQIRAEGRTGKRQRSDGARRRKRIFLVDQHALTRDAIARWIGCTADLEVCGEAGSLPSALAGIARSRPDLVLMEIMRSDNRGPELLRAIRLHTRRPVLVLSSQNELLYARSAQALGASGYLMKGVHGARLITGIRKTLRGRAVFSRAVTVRLNPKERPARPRVGPRPPPVVR